MGRITISDFFEEIQSILWLKKEDGNWADPVFQLEDFHTFQPRDNGMVTIALRDNSSREFLGGD